VAGTEPPDRRPLVEPRIPLSSALTQFVERDGILDLGYGHPDPDLLPVEGLRSAFGRVLDRYGHEAAQYGNAQGPRPLIDSICSRLAFTDSRAPRPDEVLITAGNSQALDQIATLQALAGDVVHVESPTYHLALRILRDHQLDLVGIPSDHEGIRVDLLIDSVRSLRRAGRQTGLVYLVPTFSNPTGRSLSDDRRQELAVAAAAEGLVILEDDAYRELAYDAAPPPSLWSIAEPGTTIRMGSFSKSLTPGLRVGYVTADAPTVRRFVEGGLLDSGGGYNHFGALGVAEFMAQQYAAHVETLQFAFRERRNRLLDALAEHLPAGSEYDRPGGGYFVWVTLPAGVDATTLLPTAESHGASYVPGSAFYVGPHHAARHLRLAFTRYPPHELALAVARLGLALALDPRSDSASSSRA
jgi:2-aminoadipate transaminase